MSLNKDMGNKHEKWLQSVLGGRLCPGSGSHWRNQMDVRRNRLADLWAWAVDGKSTRAKSISIPRTMLDKAVEQAAGERPMIAIRFYDDDRLRSFEDWFLVRADDFIELDRAANPDPYDDPDDLSMSGLN
jgi:hypothetical protein